MNLYSKIFNLYYLKYRVLMWKWQGKKIVFTNGCFDILHLGHVEYLNKAKELGDILIVGVNSDVSPYWKTKPNRPINDEKARSLIVSSLMFVDAVVLFDEETPLDLISEIVPDVLVKGGDYVKKDIVGYDIVTKNGGNVETIALTEGYSTTNIINQL